MNDFRNRILTVTVMIATTTTMGYGQVVMSGRVWMPRLPDSQELYPLTTILGFGTPNGPRRQSISTRTWETEPAGWFYLSGHTGRYTFAFAGPGRFMRPFVITNQYLRTGDDVIHDFVPRSDYAIMWERAWDSNPAHAYYQTFRAVSTGITHVGFKLAHDGVDGDGPRGQHLIATVHQVRGEQPDSWPQIGPAVPVLGVNAGGVLNIQYAAGWNSGEVPTTPGDTYAVRLATADPTGGFQCYWSPDIDPQGDCYRVAKKGESGWTNHDMWLYVAGDGDGLFVPFNKRVQREFHDLAGFGRKWSQTYRAQGRGLAAVMLYAAIAVDQGSLLRQRLIVRVRENTPDGRLIGTEKLAIGQTTATAHSGVFGVCFEPGEVDLEPGHTYAIEFESFTDQRGFNPWQKQPDDPYEAGRAYANATDGKAYDLDMIIVEYEQRARRWPARLDKANLLQNGNMEKGEIDPANPDAGGPTQWTRFALDPGTAYWYRACKDGESSRIASVAGGSLNGQTVDGGYFQAVRDLSHAETYRLSGRLRSSWPTDHHHQAFIGYDATGQTHDTSAPTIQWTVLPDTHGVWQRHVSEPIRPAAKAISVWLRARTTQTSGEGFVVDFDDLALNKIDTGVPGMDTIPDRSPQSSPEN